MADSDDTEVLSVTTTLGSHDEARALAAHILEARLAGCVQLDTSVTSLYRWEGRLCDEQEVRLVIKTAPGYEARLQELFARHHPYDLPQFLVARMRASPAYGQWIRQQLDVAAG